MLVIYYNTKTFYNLANYVYNYYKTTFNNIIITDKDDFSEKNLYIIFGSHLISYTILSKLKYIVFQMEQSTWGTFGDEYVKILQNALEIWDYSLVNYQYMSSKLKLKNIKYVELLNYGNENHENINEDIDLLFFGLLNDRRLSIINKIKENNKGYNIIATSNVWGDNLISLIKRAKIIVNIHYINNSILEVERLSNILSVKRNAFIISESSCDPILDKLYRKYITFNNDLENLNLSTITKTINNVIIDFPMTTLPNIDCYKMYDNDNDVEENMNNISDEIYEIPFDLNENEIMLKLPLRIDINNMPNVSIVTLTYNRETIFKNAIRNFNMINYPQDKLETKDDRIKYYYDNCKKSIADKRNFGISKTSNEIIVFMDDDDYYYSDSVYNRVMVLLNYREFSLVGVTKLDMHDIVTGYSARKSTNKNIAEASMAFYKSFWQEQQFKTNKAHGEGYSFCKNRYDKICAIPSCFCMIAITHNNNVTESGRRINDLNKKVNILNTLNISDKIFLEDLFI